MRNSLVALASLVTIAAAQPDPTPGVRRPQRSPAQEQADLRREQDATRHLYQRPEYDPACPPPANAAEWYAVLPRDTGALVGWPGSSALWTALDYDRGRPGLLPSPTLDRVPPRQEFKREALYFLDSNTRAVDLFVRASRIEACDWIAADAWNPESARWQDRHPSTTIMHISRLVRLAAQARWEERDRRGALNFLAATVRAASQLSSGGSVFETGGAQAVVQVTVDEIAVMLDQWPAPGPAAADVREVVDAMEAIDPRDPLRTISSWYDLHVEEMAKLTAEVEADGSGASAAARIAREYLIVALGQVQPFMIEVGIATVHEGLLPLATMTPEQVRTAVAEALPRLESIRDMMLEGGKHDQIVANAAEALNDPDFIEPLAIHMAVGTSRMVEDLRQRRAAMLERLRAIGDQ